MVAARATPARSSCGVKFAAEQIRAHQRVSKQLVIVTQVAEKVLHGNLTSRLRICSRHVVHPLIRHSMRANLDRIGLRGWPR